MAIFSEFLGGAVITATSPDNNITFELEDGNSISMFFAEGTYRRYSEAALEAQLAALARLVWVGHRRAHLAALSHSAGYPVDSGDSQLDPRGREFREQRSQTTVAGRSSNGYVTVSSIGLTGWKFRISPGAIAKFSEEQLLQEVWSAFLSLWTDYRRKMTNLKHEIYGIGPSAAE